MCMCDFFFFFCICHCFVFSFFRSCFKCVSLRSSVSVIWGSEVTFPGWILSAVAEARQRASPPPPPKPEWADKIDGLTEERTAGGGGGRLWQHHFLHSWAAMAITNQSYTTTKDSKWVAWWALHQKYSHKTFLVITDLQCSSTKGL